MQIKCEYCGAYISEEDEVCDKCGAVNAGFKRTTDGTPRTIEELKAWYKSKNLPPEEVTRFFIGEDYKGARAFGIYEEDGEYIVYKNKDDGTRAVRYKGKDQAYAVNELFLKLKSEILNQKAHNINNKKNGSEKQGKSNFIVGAVYSAIVGIAILATVVSLAKGVYKSVKDMPYAGNYYSCDGDLYYCDSYVDDSWYIYDYDDRDYLPVNIPQQMYDDIQSYRFSVSDDWDNSLERFEDTPMGEYIESLHDSSDSDYSWDSSDSWDSDSSDWGSDW